MARVLIGTAGWSYPDWEGIVYPRRKPSGFHPLRYIAQFCDIAEINNSFYRIPSPESAASWVRAVEDVPQFEFTAKLYQGLTHQEKSDTPDAAQCAEYHRFLRPLAESGRFSGILIQFPFRFHATKENWEYAATLFAEFRAYPLILELRHSSWWKPRLFHLCEENNVAIASIDQPELKDNIPADLRMTGPFGYVRFHGRNAANWWTSNSGPDRYDYLYSSSEISEWAERIKTLLPRGRDIKTIFNNHVRGQGLADGMVLAAALGRVPKPVPATLFERYAELLAPYGYTAAPAETADAGLDLFEQ